MFGFLKRKWSDQQVSVLSKEISEIFKTLFLGMEVPQRAVEDAAFIPTGRE